MVAAVPTIRLAVIPEPAPNTATVLVSMDGKPFFAGPFFYNLVCGSCDAMLCRGVEKGMIRNIVFCCPKCGAHNLATGDE